MVAELRTSISDEEIVASVTSEPISQEDHSVK